MSAQTEVWSSLEVGHVNRELVGAPLTITDFVRYQGASGDMNPMHHDVAFAQAAGYPGPFAVGMLTAGVLATYATDWLGPRNIRRFKVQFREQAWPGDVIRYNAVVTAVREEDVQRLIDIELTANRDAGGLHIRGWATFTFPS
jgi:acyl dehydratase